MVTAMPAPSADSQSGRDADTAPFGFSEVPRAEKAARVRAVFDTVASRYDLMNDLMSVGLHRIWKDILADRINPQPGETILDIAGGTGDIARRLAKRADRARSRRGGPAGEIIVVDVNREMLAAGQARGGGGKLAWICGDAEALPFADGIANACTIAFGIRNVTNIDRALSEVKRVLKRGGRFACLEFSTLAVGALSGVYDAYSFHAIPAIGKFVANDEGSYRYLVESIRRFPDQETFAAMLLAAGFKRVGFQNLSAGVAALHTGWAI
jgi:demethylmenaquinone methyltransferase / 2-methoxy-6-polyprenyl-1,4-benzoquinol methylase